MRGHQQRCLVVAAVGVKDGQHTLFSFGVELRSGFVGDQDERLGCQGLRDQHSLPLAATQLMRIGRLQTPAVQTEFLKPPAAGLPHHWKEWREAVERLLRYVANLPSGGMCAACRDNRMR